MTGRVLAALVVGALLVVGLLVAVLRESPAPARVAGPALASLAPAGADADDLARAACVRLRLAAQAIRADSPAERVRTELAAARVLAAEAVREDGTFAPLSGGVAALDEAVRRDDGAAAAVGLRVALDQCDQLVAG